MTGPPIDIPPAWRQLDLDGLRGPLLVVGAPDVGKSTFARYLFETLRAAAAEPVAYLDGDPGQTQLGPPTTQTLVVGRAGERSFPPPGPAWRYFVGSTSPRGHMLATLVGAARLVQVARQQGAQSMIYDTSGLIDPSQGGLNLKAAKIDLLQPAAVFAIQHDKEMEPLLVPLRRSRRVRVVTLEPSLAARRRDNSVRRRHRAEQYAEHFGGARPLQLDWTRLAIFPFPRFSLNRLVAFEDEAGFTLGLGLVIAINRTTHHVTLLTPLATLRGVNALRLGDLAVDPHTFADAQL